MNIPSNVAIAGEWFGLAPIESVEGTSHNLRESMEINTNTPELPWSSYSFYIHMIYRDLIKADTSLE